MSDLDIILQKLSCIRIWQQSGRSAPHKPLLLLYALGQFAQGHRSFPYSKVDSELRYLLMQFGPQLEYYRTEYPFWRLQNDGLWIVTADKPIESGANGADAHKTELIDKNARGAFSEELIQVLKADPRNLKIVTATLLDQNFPVTIHHEILIEVGLYLQGESEHRKRSPNFRRKVLRAYESKCCVCGYDLRLGDMLAGIEAAHIKGHYAGGPDIVPNGLALCTLHHKVFDLGCFTVEPDSLKIIFSQKLTGANQRGWLLEYHGVTLSPPQSDEYLPDTTFLNWHRNNVFKGPART